MVNNNAKNESKYFLKKEVYSRIFESDTNREGSSLRDRRKHLLYIYVVKHLLYDIHLHQKKENHRFWRLIEKGEKVERERICRMNIALKKKQHLRKTLLYAIFHEE